MSNKLWEAANHHRGCLSHLSTQTGHRRYPVREDEDQLEMQDIFASDEAKILSSKAFRLLAHKTQVLTFPKSPFVRTRLSHVMEVAANAVVVSDMLGLNTSLARAIALGHDTGHVPFGHQGEYFLAKHMGRKEFCHEVLGPLVAQKIERRGKGLNLTFETLEGMMCHSGNKAHADMTQEAWVVRFVDKIAYLFADYSDMLKRVHFPLSSSLHDLMREFGNTHRERTTTAMAGLILESFIYGRVSFDKSDLGKKFTELRSEMMKVYPRVTEQNLEASIVPVLEFLESLDIGDPYLMFVLMTDQDVKRILDTQKPRDITCLEHTALHERLDLIRDMEKIDLCDPDLGWHTTGSVVVSTPHV